MEELEELVGGTIEHIGQDEDNEGYYCLMIRKDGRKYNAWIMKDAECNAPGHLHIEED
jgi:hypothetical protein